MLICHVHYGIEHEAAGRRTERSNGTSRKVYVRKIRGRTHATKMVHVWVSYGRRYDILGKVSRVKITVVMITVFLSIE